MSRETVDVMTLKPGDQFERDGWIWEVIDPGVHAMRARRMAKLLALDQGSYPAAKQADEGKELS